MRTVLVIAAVSAVVLAGAASSARADIFRTIDAQGYVKYSDRWSPGAVLIKSDHASQHTKSDAQPASQPAQAAPSHAQSTSDQAHKAAAQAVHKDMAKVRREQCKQATQRYQKAIHARRIYHTGKNGARVYLTDAQADQERVQDRVRMQSVCGSTDSASP